MKPESKLNAHAGDGFRDHNLGRYDELRESDRVVVEIGEVSVGVYFVRDEIRAWRNICPHMGGPVCQGKMMPRTLELFDENGKGLGLALSKEETNIVCPWHGLEFNVLTGLHPIDSRTRLTPVPVRLADGDVILSLPEPVK